jgi:hypothetical protein
MHKVLLSSFVTYCFFVFLKVANLSLYATALAVFTVFNNTESVNIILQVLTSFNIMHLFILITQSQFLLLMSLARHNLLVNSFVI